MFFSSLDDLQGCQKSIDDFKIAHLILEQRNWTEKFASKSFDRRNYSGYFSTSAENLKFFYNSNDLEIEKRKLLDLREILNPKNFN